ncbi:transposable element Tcb2 transposase [Nephila pilipes]|uniref:Transposable element Tcb2 transposase n=1 Tax=Nephila pilipes TaxID=299642 RepID=A0A8X6NP70_NEPPI|nr:transposable element Tcb2 transposase [Nephila pilipes]
MDFRHAIYHLFEEKRISERKIAQILGLSPSTVHYWITRQGESATTKSGRPRVTDADTDQALYNASRKDPFLSAVDLQKELTPTCSVDTVRSRLKQQGLKCRTPARKPFLTQYHRQMRYVFAHAHLHWSVPEWHRVVFSDEKSCIRPCSTYLQPGYMQQHRFRYWPPCRTESVRHAALCGYAAPR